jgi:hypothetical protein
MNQSAKKEVRKSGIRWGKITMWVLLLAFIAIQFFQPDKNNNSVAFTNDISAVAVVPAPINHLLQQACYDCHSNNTRYPWYTNIQPVGWWLNGHINNGKRHLNFNEFATYAPDKQREKLDEIISSQREGWMPLNSYTWIHKDARLTATQRQQIITWAEGVKAKLANN